MRLWQETALVRVNRGKSHLDELHGTLPLLTLHVWEEHQSASQTLSAKTSWHISVLWHWKARFHSTQVICYQENIWNSENVEWWEKHFSASASHCSLWALSAQWESWEAWGYSCCVPRQHGHALSQGDKGLLANIHIPIHLMNTSWPWRIHWSGSLIQGSWVLNKHTWTNPSSSFTLVTSGQCMSNITPTTENLHAANLYGVRHEQKGIANWEPNYKTAITFGK